MVILFIMDFCFLAMYKNKRPNGNVFVFSSVCPSAEEPLDIYSFMKLYKDEFYSEFIVTNWLAHEFLKLE